MAAAARELTPLPSDTSEDATANFLRDLDSDPDLPMAPRRDTESEPIRTTPSQTFQATPFPQFKSKDGIVATESELEPRLEPEWKYSPSSVDLLSLPNEVRHMIYDYLIFENLIENCGQRDHVTTLRGLTNVSRVSRTLRHEFLSYLLATTEIHTTFEWLPRLVASLSGLLHVRESFVVLLFDPIDTKEPVDLLPVLELVLQTPLLSLRFELSSSTDLRHPEVTTISDLNHLLQSCRTNEALNGQIRDQVLLSVVFHSDKYLSERYPNSNMTARIQIRFKKPFRRLWMDGTHSSDELRDFLIVTGLDAFTTIKVWVGVASMRACGKGLRTPSQMQEIAYVQGRTGS